MDSEYQGKLMNIVSKIKEVMDEFSIYGIQLSEYDKEAINNYIDSLSNFHRIIKRSERRHFKLSLMKKPPFIPPSSS